MSTRVFEERWTVSIPRLFAVIVLASVVWTEPALSQVQRSGGGGANAQLVQQYQQLASERVQLQADNAKLKKDVDDLKKQLTAAQQQAAASKAGAERGQAAALASARAASESSQKSLDESKAKMQELVARFRETITQLHGVESDRAQSQQELSESRSAFDECADRNYSLYQINNEVLDRYEHQGAFSYLERAEPFTRLKRTQVENLVDGYKQKAEELRIKKRQASAGPPATTSPSAPGNPSQGPGPTRN
jgi:chaperonin cofactor prefoldin